MNDTKGLLYITYDEDAKGFYCIYKIKVQRGMEHQKANEVLIIGIPQDKILEHFSSKILNKYAQNFSFKNIHTDK